MPRIPALAVGAARRRRPRRSKTALAEFRLSVAERVGKIIDHDPLRAVN
jgi:hypothetical protein